MSDFKLLAPDRQLDIVIGFLAPLYEVKKAEVLGKGRSGSVRACRRASMLFLRRAGWSKRAIGDAFGRHYTTVTSNCEKAVCTPVDRDRVEGAMRTFGL